MAIDLANLQERMLADAVHSFAATPDGRTLAVTRTTEGRVEIWIVERASGSLLQITNNAVAESGLSWAPDGMSLVYAAAPTLPPALPEWQSWSAWCATAEVRRLDLPSGAEQTLGPGCEPAFAPDGRRIAFVTPPVEAASGDTVVGAANAIRLVNRYGANGWDVVRAGGAGETDGLAAYAPAWSPDGARLAYQRFLGYRALVDINLTETTSSYRRGGQPVGLGAGWMAPPRYAPDGAYLAVTEYNYSDARGFTGYDVWSTTVLRLGERTTVELPFGSLMMEASDVADLSRATTAAWSPDGAALAVVLPAGWTPGVSASEPRFGNNLPGELWRWDLGDEPNTRLAAYVDFGSPVIWLPAPPTLIRREAGITLAVPSGWRIRPIATDYVAAEGPDGQRLAARLRAGGPPGDVAALFPELLAPDARLGEPFRLPDGSQWRTVEGSAPDGRPRAGILRLTPDSAVALIYLTVPERRPIEQAFALSLLHGRPDR